MFRYRASASVGALFVLSFASSLGAGGFGKAETPIRHGVTDDEIVVTSGLGQ
jgi:hypothetical protein